MPKSLAETFHQVFDPRSRHGSIRDLVPTLSLAVVAGRTRLAGIARFGRDHKAAHALGFRRGTTPSLATYSRLFRRLDIDAFEAVLGQWIVQRCPDLGDHVALDGKTLRRSRPPARRVRADGAGRDALHRMHDAGESNRKAATERLQVRPEEAIDLLHSRKCET